MGPLELTEKMFFLNAGDLSDSFVCTQCNIIQARVAKGIQDLATHYREGLTLTLTLTLIGLSHTL